MTTADTNLTLNVIGATEGRTIAKVTQRSMVNRDAYKDYDEFTETTLHFTDGHHITLALDHGESYGSFEVRDCATCDHPVAFEDGRSFHPFGHDTFDHDGQWDTDDSAGE